MANAKIKTETVTKTVVVEEKAVELALSREEAAILMTYLGTTSAPSNTRTGRAIHAIYGTLYDLQRDLGGYPRFDRLFERSGKVRVEGSDAHLAEHFGE